LKASAHTQHFVGNPGQVEHSGLLSLGAASIANAGAAVNRASDLMRAG
jgi:hypothetical protein